MHLQWSLSAFCKKELRKGKPDPGARLCPSVASGQAHKCPAFISCSVEWGSDTRLGPLVSLEELSIKHEDAGLCGRPCLWRLLPESLVTGTEPLLGRGSDRGLGPRATGSPGSLSCAVCVTALCGEFPGHGCVLGTCRAEPWQPPWASQGTGTMPHAVSTHLHFISEKRRWSWAVQGFLKVLEPSMVSLPRAPHFPWGEGRFVLGGCWPYSDTYGVSQAEKEDYNVNLGCGKYFNPFFGIICEI